MWRVRIPRTYGDATVASRKDSMNSTVRKIARTLGVAGVAAIATVAACAPEAGAANTANHTVKIEKAPEGWTTPYALHVQLTGYVLSGDPFQVNRVRINTLPLSAVSTIWDEDFNFAWDASFGAKVRQCFRVDVTAWNDPTGSAGLTFGQTICSPAFPPLPATKLFPPPKPHL